VAAGARCPAAADLSRGPKFLPLVDGEHVHTSTAQMFWNNTQFDYGLPIAIAAARQVGEVLKYVPESQEIAPRYSFYM
jgi:hypothetical protein